MIPVNRRLNFYNSTAAAEHYLGIRWPRAIWQAVLEQAIADAVEGLQQFELEGLSGSDAAELNAAVRQAALDWIDDDSLEPRRFAWVCEQLNLEPTAVRAAVLKRGKL